MGELEAAARAWRLAPAVRALRAGGVIAYPTEAVFGLGCAPRDEHAVRRILALKGRSAAKGLILIAADLAQLRQFVRVPSGDALLRMRASWPGPVTWVLPARSDVPRWLRGRHPGLAVRVSAHPVCVELCRRFGGAVVSTSANRSGEAPARSAREVARRFGAALDWVVRGPTGGAARPSEIRDARSGRVLRAG